MEQQTATNDLYPSRLGATPALTERLDPVVYGKGSKPFSARQLERFRKDGYLLAPALFSPQEAQLLLKDAELLKLTGEIPLKGELIREPDSGAIRSVFNVHRLAPMFASLARDRRLVDRMRQLLGSDVYIHQSRVNFKPGFTGKEFYWHSDFETWHVEDGMPRMRAVSCSIALTDNHEFNGPLMVMPGSHRHYISCAGRTPENHYEKSLRKQEYGVPEPGFLERMAKEGGITAPKGRAGSVVFFDCNIMHGSNSNITPFPRSNIFMVYNSVENPLVEPYGGTAPRPDFVASRDFTPLVPETPNYSLLGKGNLQ